MDENSTIFQNPNSQQSSSFPGEPPDPFARNPFAPQQPQQPPPPPPPAPNILPPESEFGPPPQEGFPLIKIVLAIVGIIAVVGIFIFLITLFVGKKNTNEKVTLTVWGLWESENIMNTVIKDFERQNPTITVNYLKEDPNQYTDRLLARSQNGLGPDVFYFHNTWVPQLASLLAPLSSATIQKQDFQQWYYPVASKDLIKNGAIYGIPMEIDTLALFTNTNIFQAAGAKVPTTWNDFINVSRALTVKDATGVIKTAGAAIGTYGNITHASDLMSLLFVQNGADMFHLTATQQNASDSINFYTSFTKGDGNVWDSTSDQSLKAFAKGSLAMYFGYSYDIFAIQGMNPALSFQVYPVPHLPGRNQTIASYWVAGASVKSKHQKEAMLFMHFLAQKDTVQKLYTEEAKTRPFGEPYGRVDLAQSLKDNPLVYPFVQQGKDAVSGLFAGETFNTSFNGQLNTYLGNAINAVNGDTSPDSAVGTLAQGVSQVLNQYGQQ